MEFVPYITITVLVVFDLGILAFIRKKILAMDSSTPEGQQAQQRLPKMMAIIIISTVIMSAVLFATLKPLFPPAAPTNTISTNE